MNNAKKVREMERIYFYESKDNEINKSELQDISKKYEALETLCKDLIDSFDSMNDITIPINKIKHHLIHK